MDLGYLVSVIIPVYNVQTYLREALDSVLCQTYTNLEIIIIDDGSTDNCGGICDEYARKDSRILVIHQNNRGLSAARNTGLENANGKVIAFLDSDDSYCPDYINEMIAEMIYKKSDIVVCKYTTHKTVDILSQTGNEKLEPSIMQGKYNRKSALRALADRGINVGVWNKIYKHELWSDIRFPEGHVSEDLDTTYKLFDRCNSVVVLDKPLYMYRIRPGSITFTYSYKNINDRIIASSHFDLFIEEHIGNTFSLEQRNLKKKECLKVLFVLYFHHRGRKKEGEITRSELRLIIIKLGKLVNIKTCSHNIRIAYPLICHCPFILDAIYGIYHLIHMAIRSIIRR